MGAVDTNVGSLLNEVLSITAQECRKPYHTCPRVPLLNEVLSITAQESREACPEILYGVHPQ